MNNSQFAFFIYTRDSFEKEMIDKFNCNFGLLFLSFCRIGPLHLNCLFWSFIIILTVNYLSTKNYKLVM
jgi:hypothetical protein